MDEGWLTHLATNGAGTIHDWEFAWLGRSTESVRENVATGTFGTWDETGRNIHLALLAGAPARRRLRRSLGRFIAEDGVTLPRAGRTGELPCATSRPIRSRPPGPSCCRRCVSTDWLPAATRSSIRWKRHLDPRAGLPPGRAAHGPSGHRLRHHHQPSDVQRRGDRPGGGPGFPPVRRRGREAGRRRGAVGRLGHHGPAGVREEPELREQPAPPGRPARRPRPHDLRRRPAGRRRLGLDRRRAAQGQPGLLPALLQELRPHGRRDALRPVRQRGLPAHTSLQLTRPAHESGPASTRSPRTIPGLRIAVVGDFCLDRYLEIDPAREETSIETGLPVHNVVRVRGQPGGAGTILNNLVALGVGRDLSRRLLRRGRRRFELRRALRGQRGVRLDHFFTRPSAARSPTASRLSCDPANRPEELNRLDSKNWTPTPELVEATNRRGHRNAGRGGGRDHPARPGGRPGNRRRHPQRPRNDPPPLRRETGPADPGRQPARPARLPAVMLQDEPSRAGRADRGACRPGLGGGEESGCSPGSATESPRRSSPWRKRAWSGQPRTGRW